MKWTKDQHQWHPQGLQSRWSSWKTENVITCKSRALQGTSDCISDYKALLGPQKDFSIKDPFLHGWDEWGTLKLQLQMKEQWCLNYTMTLCYRWQNTLQSCSMRHTHYLLQFFLHTYAAGIQPRPVACFRLPTSAPLSLTWMLLGKVGSFTAHSMSSDVSWCRTEL